MDQESAQPAPTPSGIIPVNQIPPFSKSKLPMILMVVILLILFTGVGIVVGKYLLAPQTTPIIEKTKLLSSPSPKVPTTPIVSIRPTTVSVNIYINEQAGFSVLFPQGWRIPNSVYKNTPQVTGTEVGLGWGLQWSKNSPDNQTPPVIMIQKNTSISADNLSSYSKTDCGWITSQGSSLSVKDIIIDKHQAKEWENTFLDIRVNKSVYHACVAISGTPGFIISWSDDQAQRTVDFDQILSTFKFL